MDLPATDPGSDLCDLSDSGDENYTLSTSGPSRRDAGIINFEYIHYYVFVIFEIKKCFAFTYHRLSEQFQRLLQSDGKQKRVSQEGFRHRNAASANVDQTSQFVLRR